MDNFIDKFAQRRSAQEMIRANAMAEAEERERMTARLSEYEMAMQEMRRCNLQNMENAEKVKELLAASLNKIEKVQKKDEGSGEKQEKAVQELKVLLESMNSQMAEILKEQQTRAAEFFESQQKNQIMDLLKKQRTSVEEQNQQMKELMGAQQKVIEELLQGSEEFNHREAVKVYRNVQAVIEGALPKQTAEITEAVRTMTECEGMSPGLVIIWILTFLAAAGNIAIEVLKILGYL